MSDNYLRIIPINPDFVPTEEAQIDAYRQFGCLAYGKPLPEFHLQTISDKDGELVRAGHRDWCLLMRVFDQPHFIDNGCNLERVSCPLCGALLTFEFWHEELDKASNHHFTHFTDLRCTLACCGASVSLNDLDYEWPVGFARFELEALEGRRLVSEEISQLEQIIGCSLRQIMAHY